MNPHFTFVFTCLLLAGCSTFHGPGNYRGPGEGETAPAGPTLTWNGTRNDSTPSEGIELDWPVDEARLTRGFKLGPGKPHWGVDLANHKGTPVLAAEKGTVVYAGRGFHGYGNLLVIEHNQEWATMYAHLSKFLVKEGQQVKRGEKIGLMGRTGHATGVHLHFEVRRNRQPVNPLAYLPEGFGTAPR